MNELVPPAQSPETPIQQQQTGQSQTTPNNTIVQPVQYTSPPQSASPDYIHYIEIAGLMIAIFLFIGILSGSTVFSQIALFAFAIIGAFAVANEIVGSKTSTNTPVHGTTQQLSANELQAQTQKPKNTGKTILKVASISVLAVLTAVFVLPAVGMFLIIILFVIFGGGQSTG